MTPVYLLSAPLSGLMIHARLRLLFITYFVY